MSEAEKRLQYLIEKSIAHGATGADAVCFDSTDMSVSVRLGEVETIDRSESNGLGLRVMVGRQQAIVSTTDIRTETLDTMAERAVSMAKIAPEDPYIALANEQQLAQSTQTDLDIHDATIRDSESLTEDARQCEDAARSVNGITNSEGAQTSYGQTNVTLATSHGFCASYGMSSHALSVSVIAGDGTAMERDYDYAVRRYYADLPSPEEIGMRASERTLKRLNPKKPKTGSVPVVFDPRVSRNLVGHIASAVNGASIARGTSFLRDKMGEAICHSDITITNDATLKRGLASKPFDAEGISGTTLTIIDKGVLKEWLLDMRSANQLGLITNGCATRALAGSPSPCASNMNMQAGSQSPEALIADIESGFYITDGFGGGVNTTTGDYSQGASGFWIENGKITYPVSELTIASTLQDMLIHMTPANDLRYHYSMNAPTLRIERMTVAGE